tara:strand:+ start:229 stop:420 length:192 start_codon:yes stop_codon:yes gene_type:complete
MDLEGKKELFLDIPEQLVKDLDQLFPSTCPTIDMTEREIFMYAGKRAMVEWLMERRDMQEFEG